MFRSPNVPAVECAVARARELPWRCVPLLSGRMRSRTNLPRSFASCPNFQECTSRRKIWGNGKLSRPWLPGRERGRIASGGDAVGGEEAAGGSGVGDGDFAEGEGRWLQGSFAESLRSEGHSDDLCDDVSEAAAEALVAFLSSKSSTFDPLVLMDALEEGIERRGVRGNFLPFEVGEKAGRLLCERWGGERRPSHFTPVLLENTLDVVDLKSMPTQPRRNIGGADGGDFQLIDADALVPSQEPPSSA